LLGAGPGLYVPAGGGTILLLCYEGAVPHCAGYRGDVAEEHGARLAIEYCLDLGLV